MARFRNFEPTGVIPATLLAFHDDFSIDEAETRRHLTPRRGHARHLGDHRQRPLQRGACAAISRSSSASSRFSRRRVGDRLPLVNGVYADGSIEAARIARMAAGGGRVRAARVPAQQHGWGGQLRPEMALAHFKRIADATDLPIILFQYPASTGLGYPFDTLMRLDRGGADDPRGQGLVRRSDAARAAHPHPAGAARGR